MDKRRGKSLCGVSWPSPVGGNRCRTAVGGGRDREGCSLPNGIRTGPVTSDVVASSRDQPNKRAHSTNAGTVTTTHGLPRRIAGKKCTGWPVPSTCVAAQPPKPLTRAWGRLATSRAAHARGVRLQRNSRVGPCLSEEVTMRIAVFGAGGIGGYLGARLAQAGDDVALIARGSHLRAIQEHGLFVESPTGDFHMTPSIANERPEDIGVVDVVLLGVKAWDVRAAAAAIRSMVGPTTGVLTLQNGVEAPTEVAEVLGVSHVMVGVTPVRSVIAAPGRLRHVGGVDPNLTLGEIDNQSSAR